MSKFLSASDLKRLPLGTEIKEIQSWLDINTPCRLVGRDQFGITVQIPEFWGQPNKRITLDYEEIQKIRV